MVGGQLLYYGPLLEAARFWKNLGADIVMLKPHKYEDFFINDFSGVNSKYKKIIGKIRDMGLQILLHPEHIKTPEFILEPSDPGQHERLTRALLALAELIKEYELYPEICFGPPALLYPPYKFLGQDEISEETGMKYSISFFRRLSPELRKRKISLSLETYPDHKFNFTRQTYYKMLCYSPEHFEKLLGDNLDVYSLCIDTGHVKLSRAKIVDYLALLYKVTILHLHSNNGNEDEHKLLTIDNAPEGTEELLHIAKGPKILELRNKETQEEFRQSIESIRQNKLPDL